VGLNQSQKRKKFWIEAGHLFLSHWKKKKTGDLRTGFSAWINFLGLLQHYGIQASCVYFVALFSHYYFYFPKPVNMLVSTQ